MNLHSFSFEINKNSLKQTLEIINVFYQKDTNIGFVFYCNSYEISQKLGRNYDILLQTCLLPFKELRTETGNADCFIVKDFSEIEMIVKNERCTINGVVFDQIKSQIKYGFRIFENVDFYELYIVNLNERNFEQILYELTHLEGVEVLD